MLDMLLDVSVGYPNVHLVKLHCTLMSCPPLYGYKVSVLQDEEVLMLYCTTTCIYLTPLYWTLENG